MTREEAIDVIVNDIDTYTIREGLALNMAIKALEQEPVLDKIRAEIEKEADTNNRLHGISEIGLRKTLKIIDKYNAESEGI